jgi:hypothetical protein
MKKLLGIAVVFSLAFAAPSATASAGEGSKVTDQVVETVTTTVEGAIPDPPVVEAPPIPVTPPAVPTEIPADPPSPPAEPPAAAPDPVSDLPDSVSKVVGGIKPHAAVDAVTGGSDEAATVVPDAAVQADRPPSREPGVDPGSGADQAAAGAGPPAEDPDRSSGEATQFAPVTWFLAHVWPAVAVESGSARGAVLSRIALPPTGEPGIPPLTQIAGDLFLGLNGSRPVSADLPPSASPPAADRSATPPWSSALSSGARIALYVGIAALLALLAYMLRTEFSSVPGRPGHR